MTPLESWAQAFVIAVRKAFSRVSAEAVLQSRPPLNAMQTWQWTRWPRKLEIIT
jgi:hypothetical protein